MPYLLDTNVLSETMRRDPEPAVLTWIVQNSLNCYVSVLSLGEIWQGILLLPEGSRRDAYHEWFGELALEYRERTLLIDLKVMQTWGEYTASLRRNGYRAAVFDSLLAASAICHGLVLCTRNTQDFPRVDLFNPWP